MSEEQRIWFVYLTDHHEGPFLIEEVVEKFNSGAITKASLSWKDGMAEWQPLESIPELAAAVDAGSTNASGAAPSAIPAAMPTAAAISPLTEDPAVAAVGAEEPSLAQQLAMSQAEQLIPQATNPSISLVAPESPGSLMKMSAPVVASEPSSGDPAESELVWILRDGMTVTGSFSFSQLREMAKNGQLQGSFELWRPGWTDFAPGSRYPELIVAKKTETSDRTQGAITAPRSAATGVEGLTTLIKKAGVQPARSGLSKSLVINTDGEATDPGIIRPKKVGGFAKIFGALGNLFKRKKTASPVAIAPTAVKKSGTFFKIVKRLAVYLVLLAVAGAGGAYYYLFIMSPIPVLEDVLPEQYNLLKEAARSSPSKIFAAVSQEDVFNPKIYAASSLPEGTILSMHLAGITGKLVNVLNFDTKLNAPLKANLATFGPVTASEGKPIPMGEYNLTISANNAEKFQRQIFLGGPKGAIYERRMKQYQEKLQQGYDQEIQELREMVGTIKGLRDDYEKKLAELSSKPLSAKSSAWKGFGGTFSLVMQQLDTKIKAKVQPAAGVTPADVFYPAIYNALLAVVQQLQEGFNADQSAIDGGKPSASAAMLASVQTNLAAQEQVVAQAITRSPLEALSFRNDGSSGIVAPTPPQGAVVVPTAAPAVPAPVPAQAAPAANVAPVAEPPAVPAPRVTP